MKEIAKVGGKEYELVSNGITQGPTSLIVKFKAPNETLEETEETFAGAERIEVENEEKELVAAFNDYNKVSAITKQYGQNVGIDEDGNALKADTVTMLLEKPDRIDALEDAVDALTIAILSGNGNEIEDTDYAENTEDASNTESTEGTEDAENTQEITNTQKEGE